MTCHALILRAVFEPLTAHERLTLARLEREYLATIHASRRAT